MNRPAQQTTKSTFLRLVAAGLLIEGLFLGGFGVVAFLLAALILFSALFFAPTNNANVVLMLAGIAAGLVFGGFILLRGARKAMAYRDK